MVEALRSWRGINRLTAVTLMAEPGDIRCVAYPRPLMSRVGLVPSEQSSGPRRRQGGIIRSGNSHLRRVPGGGGVEPPFPGRKDGTAAAQDPA